MKLKNNKEINKLFLIMGVFSIVALGAGVQIGFELRDDIYKTMNSSTTEVYNTSKAIIAEDNILYESLQPKLTIEKTEQPVVMSYTIKNITTSTMYVETAKIKVYNKNNEKIYTTKLNVYKTYLPDETDKLYFQIPQQADEVAKVDISFD